MKRIGILTHEFSGWGGGIDFLRLVTSSLRHADPEVELHVLIPSRGPLIQLRNLRDWFRLKLGRSVGHRLDLSHLERAIAGAGVIVHHIDLGAYAVIVAAWRFRLEAVLPATRPKFMAGVPWVGYIFDFQHKYLPQFFTEKECNLRDRAFRTMLNSANAVIVNSAAVAKDIEHYYPIRRAKVFAMPFSPAPGHDAFASDPEAVAKRYRLSGPFFIICNQFWKHKDHGTAFRAFAMVADRYPGLLLVCTGATSDYRDTRYFDQLMDQARQNGVVDRIVCLGLIPKLDQLALLRGAIALIQPTLFEGGPGGGAVYDAVAVGQRSIVSDIGVNREIDDPTVTFFKAGDAQSLRRELEATIYAYSSSESVVHIDKLVACGVERRHGCGMLLYQAIRHATQARNKLT